MSRPFQDPPQPKPWRVAFGFLMAPLVPAALWLLPGFWHGTLITSFGSQLILVTTYGPYPAVVLLGVPAYFLLRRRLRPRLLTLASAGGIIAVAPWAAMLPMLSNPSDGWIGSCHTVIGGQATLCGYLEGVKFMALVFGLGTIGGIVFWICAIWGDPNFIGSSAAAGAERRI